MKKVLLGIVVLLVLAAGAIALLSFVFDKEKKETYSITGTVTEIVVKSDSGNVDLVPGTGIEVRETQHYVFGKPSFDQDLKNGVLTLKSDCDTPVIKCYSDLDVTVPKGIRVTVEADSGDIDAQDLDVRNAHLESDSGDITANLNGRVLLAWAHTDSGDVDVVAEDARAVDAKTDSGDVKVDADGDPSKIVAITDSGDVDVIVPAGAYAIDADTDSGDVDTGGLQKSTAAKRSIEAKTDSGDVNLRAR